jgi:hypothetical protein
MVFGDAGILKGAQLSTRPPLSASRTIPARGHAPLEAFRWDLTAPRTRRDAHHPSGPLRLRR